MDIGAIGAIFDLPFALLSHKIPLWIFSGQKRPYNFLLGHIYAFVTELVPYYLHHYDIVEGPVENFVEPTDRYNRAESFRVNGITFHYNYNDITFGYHDTILDNGIITAWTANVCIAYVHNPLNGANAIMRIELIQ